MNAHIERSGGFWEVSWWSQDEQRYYRWTFGQYGAAERWAKRNGFKLIDSTEVSR